MNSLIIKTTQFLVLLNFWLLMLLGLAGGIALANFLDNGSGVSLELGARIISIAAPGSYLLFAFVGLICMLLFAAPLYAWWALMYSSNKLLIKIERNTAAMANYALNADRHEINASTNNNFLRADSR